MRGLRLTAKERILLHLLEFTKYADSVEVPPGMTQEGIAQTAWILVPHVTQYVRPPVHQVGSCRSLVSRDQPKGFH